MPFPAPTPVEPDDPPAQRARLYVRVLLIEAAVIAGLYWFGRYFA